MSPRSLFLPLINAVLQPALKRRYAARRSASYLYERPLEYWFALEELHTHASGTEVLDVGTGRGSFPALLFECGYKVTAIDKKTSYWDRFFNHHFYVQDDDICRSKFPSASFDAITCISTLEHIPAYDAAVREISRLLKEGGVAIMTFPFTYDTYCANVYDLPESDSLSTTFNYIGQSFSEEIVQAWIEHTALVELERRYFRGWEGKFWRCGRRIEKPHFVEEKDDSNGLCVCFQKR